jgi:hypothetical protein
MTWANSPGQAFWLLPSTRRGNLESDKFPLVQIPKTLRKDEKKGKV